MELYRKELKLAVIKGLDESRGSSNVTIKLTHDTSDEYINYTEQIHIRYLFDNQVKEEILPTNDTGFYIPGKPLSHDGPIELAVHLINGDIELVTNELSFIVKNAPNGTTQVDPSEFTWQQLVDQYVNAKLETFADKADMNKFKDDVNANLSNQDKKITDLQNTTKVSLDSQNTKIDNFKSEVNTSLSNQNTSINQTTSAQNSKIATLESRMNTFTRLSEGSTTGDAELQDIRVGANGITYNNAGDAVRGQYSQLKEDLGNLEKGIGVYEYISPNMLNKYTITLNKTINENGDIVDDPNNKYCVSDYVDVSGHNSIVLGFYNVGKWNTLNTYIVAFDGGKNVIGMRGLTGTLYSVPTNAKYVRVAFSKAYIDYAMIVDGGFQVDKYYPYDHYFDYLKGIKELINARTQNVYYVGKNRTDKSFSAVVTEAVKHKNSIVYVDDGEYNIEEEFKAIYGNDFFNNFERSGRRGLYLGNGIKIIMSPNTTIKFHYSGDNANVKEMFSPFNFAPYSQYSSKDYEVNGFELRGGIIDVKNARYCSHDDPSSFNKPYINKYINVQMKLDNTENNVWGAHNCIGAGLGMYGEFNVESCTFETVGSKDTTASISIHNTAQPNAKSFISIRDNYLYGNNTIRLLYYGTSKLKTKAVVCGNSVSRQIELKPNTSDSTVENIELVAWNNEIRSN